MDDPYISKRERMVEEQIARRGIRETRLLKAMVKVPRHLFVPEDEQVWSYADGPLAIGEGQTISQPFIVALMSDLLSLTAAARVLEVGTGSGYQAAILAELAEEVHTVEILPGLYHRAQETLVSLGYINVHLHLSDGSIGWPPAAPYDGILVAASAPEIPPALLDQLAEGGRLVAPVGGRDIQQLKVWTRTNGLINCETNIPVSFVPLRGEFGWK